jgi:hypothetical protein
MYCATCGKEILECAKFCAHCGIQIGSTPLTQVTESKAETSSLRAAYNAIGNAVNRAASATGNIASAVTLQVGDLNGDGKIDAEDFKIAAERVFSVAHRQAKPTEFGFSSAEISCTVLL